MAFNDTYRESIQSKHLANVGFTSTAKGITNEGYASKNPHQVLPNQIQAVDVVGTYGPLVASGIAAGLAEQYTVKLTADPTVNNNLAWIAYADNDIEVGHAGASHIRLDQWMRYAETQYKLRLYQDNGTGTAPNYAAEILPSETAFNWEYDASAGVVYFDENPASNGKTIPLWGVFYKYSGETLADKIDTTTSGAGGNFIGLTDTPLVYSPNRVLFESDVAVVDDSDFTYDPTTDTLEIINLDVNNDATIGGNLTLSSGTSVNEIVTAMGVGSTDDQIPTAKAVYDAIEAKPNDFLGLTDTFMDSFTEGRLFVETPTGIVDFAELTYVSGTQTLGVPNINTTEDLVVEGDVTVDGSFGFDTGTTIEEFVTTIDASSTDSQVATAASVYDLVNTISGSLQDAVIWEVVDTPTHQIRPKIEHQGKAIYTAGNLTIGGDLTVSGTTTTVHSQELTVADKVITVNAGEVGAGITGDQYAGIEVDRGSETNYMFVFDEIQDNFRVGIDGSLQAVATREDVPNDGYVAVWNAAAVRFDTPIALSALATDAELASVSGSLQAVIEALNHNTDLDGLQGGTAGEYFHLTDNEYGQFSAIDANTFTFAATTALEVDGTFALATGPTVNEIVTTVVSGSTDDQLITAKAVYDAVAALGEARDQFIELTDTPENYTADRILFTTASGVVWSDDLTWDGVSLDINGDLDVSGSVAINNDLTVTNLTSTSGINLFTGATISEFSTDTTLSGNSDTAVPTEAAVKGYVDSRMLAEIPVSFNANMTYDSDVWKYSGGFTTVPDNIQVFLNGVLNRDHADYYAAIVSGGVLEITFAFPTHSDDWVSITYGDVMSSSARLARWTSVSSAYDILVGDRLMLDSSSSAFTITLPLAPQTGDEVTFLDAGGSCGTNNVVINRNGSNIMGLAQDLDIDTNDASFSLVYFNASRGWVIK